VIILAIRDPRGRTHEAIAFWALESRKEDKLDTKVKLKLMEE
jgi:hypothetical protein